MRLHWVLGLARLGFRVVFVEQFGPSPPSSAAVAWFEQVTRRFALQDATLLADQGVVSGLSTAAVRAAAADAELFVNLSGNLRDLSLVEGCAHKVYVDLDPGYTQLWHANGIDVGLAGHEHHFTVGTRIGQPGCIVPPSEIPWQPLAPPVVLEHWPVAATQPGRFTTVASWRGGYGRAEQDGRLYGVKAHEFRKVRDLPCRSPSVFELALAIDEADEGDRIALADAGWRLVSPADVAAEPEDFRAYISSSGAEFSVAQGIYAETRSGWLSDRTACYLAAGKPALVQDTGLAEEYRPGTGLIPFRSLDEAVAGAADVVADYAEHSRAARQLAEDHFGSDVVLGRLLEHVGAAP